MDIKICCACKSQKSVVEFNFNKSEKDGLCDHCRDCEKIKRKIYRAKKSAQITRKLYQTNYKKKYRESEHGKELQKMYMEKYCKTELRKASRARADHKRRSIIESLPNTLTLVEWEEIKARQGYRCALCGKVEPLTRDHIIPVSLGGSLTRENTQGLCKPCNSRKHNKLLPKNKYVNYCGGIAL